MEKLWRKDDKLVKVDDLFEMWVKLYYLVDQDPGKKRHPYAWPRG